MTRREATALARKHPTAMIAWFEWCGMEHAVTVEGRGSWNACPIWTRFIDSDTRFRAAPYELTPLNAGTRALIAAVTP